MSWDTIVARVFCEPENLQVLCKVCHKEKTMKIENKERSLLKKRRERIFNEMVGHQFGKLQVLDFHSFSDSGQARLLCECDCGEQRIVQYGNLKSGHTTSCGCLMGTHRKSNLPEYKIWSNIKSRCFNPKSTGFKYYGGRGMTMCDTWAHSFEQFYKDMGPRPWENATIDRVDVNQGYTPENCRWASYQEQANNTQDNHQLTHDGETHTISEWARKLNIKPNTIYYRIKRGWSVAEALEFTPKEENKERNRIKRESNPKTTGRRSRRKVSSKCDASGEET